MTGRCVLLALLLLGALGGCVGGRDEPRSASASRQQEGRRYTVRAGDTLSAIAARFSVDMRALAAANRLAPPYLIRIGQELTVPHPPRAARASRRDAVRRAVPPAPSLAAAAVPPTAQRPPARPAPIASSPPPAGAPRLAWPADGPVSQPFGQGGSSGILIAAHAGAAVRSAGTGTVLYAGDEPTAEGRRVLVDHGSGWITAYRRLGRLVVQPGDKVASGTRLGFVGPAGKALAPGLGFELRRNEQAFDPLPLLPPRF